MKKAFMIGLLLLISCGGDDYKETFVPGIVKATVNIGKKTISWDSVAGAKQYNLYMKQTESCADISEVPFEDPTKSDTKIKNVVSPYSIADYDGCTTCYYASIAAENEVGEGLLSVGVGWQILTCP